MLKFSIMVAILLVSVGLYGSNMNLSYAQNQALSQSGNSEAEQEIEQAQSSSQDSQCVSGDITALSCNNLGLQLQRNGDDDNGNGPNPPPNPDDCPDNYTWDITTREDGTVEENTLICFTEKSRLGNQPAFVIEPGQSGVNAQANPNQPQDDPNCNGQGQQRAEVTSGTPPQPLEMGEDLCVDVDLSPP